MREVLVVDPVTLVVMGLARCLLAGLAAGEPSLDAYWQLRDILVGRYGSSVETRLKLLERDPTAAGVQQDLGAALRRAGAAGDTDLGPLAQNLLRLVSDPASANDPIDEAWRTAGVRTVGLVLHRHVARLLDIRSRFAVPDTDLLIPILADRAEIPADLRRDLVELPARFRSIIEQVTVAIEAGRGATPRSVIGYPDRQRAERLLEADRRLRVSYESLRLTVGCYRELTAAALTRLDRACPGQSPADPDELLGDAAVMFELADLVIQLVRTFSLAGTEELDRLHGEVRDRIADQLDPEPGPERAASIAVATEEWAAYVRELDQQRARVEAARIRIPAFEAIRDGAREQLGGPEPAAMIRLLTWTADAIRTTLASLSELPLVPLTPTRVQRLLRV
jgi:hypothetical protein